ncbi:MAG: hypothetical protein OXC81_07585 [Betaproteobacteria bacterium]|nr:hypothetical protein [Betaproteobacteria bacterium]
MTDMARISAKPRDIQDDDDLTGALPELRDIEEAHFASLGMHWESALLVARVSILIVLVFCCSVVVSVFFLHLCLPKDMHFMTSDNFKIVQDALTTVVKLGVGGIMAHYWISRKIGSTRKKD